jgi:hypothetical protein
VPSKTCRGAQALVTLGRCKARVTQRGAADLRGRPARRARGPRGAAPRPPEQADVLRPYSQRFHLNIGSGG